MKTGVLGALNGKRTEENMRSGAFVGLNVLSPLGSALVAFRSIHYVISVDEGITTELVAIGAPSAFTCESPACEGNNCCESKTDKGINIDFNYTGVGVYTAIVTTNPVFFPSGIKAVGFFFPALKDGTHKIIAVLVPGADQNVATYTISTFAAGAPSDSVLDNTIVEVKTFFNGVQS